MFLRVKRIVIRAFYLSPAVCFLHFYGSIKRRGGSFIEGLPFCENYERNRLIFVRVKCMYLIRLIWTRVYLWLVRAEWVFGNDLGKLCNIWNVRIGDLLLCTLTD